MNRRPTKFRSKKKTPLGANQLNCIVVAWHRSIDLYVSNERERRKKLCHRHKTKSYKHQWYIRKTSIMRTTYYMPIDWHILCMIEIEFKQDDIELMTASYRNEKNETRYVTKGNNANVKFKEKQQNPNQMLLCFIILHHFSMIIICEQ